MEKIERIEEEIKEIIKMCLGIQIEDKTKNLLDEDNEVPIIDWLDVILEIQNKYQQDIPQYITEENFTFFTIENLAKKIAMSC